MNTAGKVDVDGFGFAEQPRCYHLDCRELRHQVGITELGNASANDQFNICSFTHDDISIRAGFEMCKAGIAKNVGFAGRGTRGISLREKPIEGSLFVKESSVRREPGVATERIFPASGDPFRHRRILAEQIGIRGRADHKAANFGSSISDVLRSQANTMDQNRVGTNAA